MNIKVYKLHRFEFKQSELEAFKAKRVELEDGKWAWVESYYSPEGEIWVQAAELVGRHNEQD